MPIFNILYGLNQMESIDLTKEVKEMFFTSPNLLKINHKFDFNKFCGDPYPCLNKTIFIFYSYVDIREDKRIYSNDYYNKIRTMIISEIREKDIIINFDNPTEESNDMNPSKNIIIYPHTEYVVDDGGINVMYYLAAIIDELNIGYNVCIYPSFGEISSPIFNKYYKKNDFNIENSTVIYCEGTSGNPLSSKFVVRWLLSELGKNVSGHMKYSYSPQDLIYYFNSELKMDREPEKKGSIYKMLSLLYKNPLYKIINHQADRYGWCFTYRKAANHHINKINNIHPNNAIEINRHENIDTYLKLYNKYKYFISYDPYTFHSMNAALCGCISIIYPIEKMSKEDWIKTTSLNEYFKFNSKEKLYGIAYGLEELHWATNTICMVEKQWKDITEYYKKNHVALFINDIEKFRQNINTSKNNFFI